MRVDKGWGREKYDSYQFDCASIPREQISATY